ncbi:hypothetical protein [Methylomonas fluvii]|uniref:Uncharacterized protein n=1 Tax=Methylomonas fluvii TaxID=1854564 RepID=A0ABR9DII8_9GAMM|nr:hypothetical protein [Methylomonas fluvii]MBD9362925.1 hypothetical protein [Methylomonas fluvii]
MSTNTITDAFRVKPKLVDQLAIDRLWIVITMNVDNHEVVSLDYQNAFAECLRTAQTKPMHKGRIERFMSKLDREFLTKTNVTNLIDFYDDADKYINTLRDEEGRLFL